MSDKEKEQKALEIYQQLIASLENVSDIPEIVSIVNSLIDLKVIDFLLVNPNPAKKKIVPQL